MLHVTNGSSVSLAETGLGGEVLIWDDVLYRPPLPGARESLLARSPAHEEVALWFEHDLYDQVQLIDILDCFHSHPGAAARLTLIASDQYLGPLTGKQLAALWPRRHDVSAAELALGAEAWRAFLAPDPRAIETLLAGDTSALPYLRGALVRHLEQLPSVDNGLSRTERQILQVLSAGHRDFASLFPAVQQCEERIFMGDTAFRRYLDRLASCPHPLVLEREGRFHITGAGRDVLAGRADHVRLNSIDAPWRWNRETGTIWTSLPA